MKKSFVQQVTFLVLFALIVVSLGACSGRAATGIGSSPKSITGSTQLASESNLRTINVNGVGEASAPPDVADIRLGVEVIETDADLVVSESTSRMATVRSAIKEMGVADEDIQTIEYSMRVESQQDKNGQPNGENRYHVVHQVRVRLHDLSQVGALLSNALAAGANTVGGVTFGVADPTALQQQARERATADARAKAEQLASALNAKLGSLRQVSESSSPIGPIGAPMIERATTASSPVPVSSGTFVVRIEIQVIFDLAE